MEQTRKPNFVTAVMAAAIIHLGRPLPDGSSDLPGNAAGVSRLRAGCSKAFPYLVLHHEEFTWPRLLPDTPVSSYLTVSPFAVTISNFKFEI